MFNSTYVKDPILSIIVPVYDVENYIEQCIKSLLRQTLKAIEIIIVNDGTRDKSVDIITKFNDARINIVNKKNGGLSSARNEGIRIASGKYITFVDGDDFIDFNEAYEEMINIISKYDADILVGNANYYYDNNKKSAMNPSMLFENKIISNEQYIIESVNTKRIFVPVWLNIYRRDLIINNNLYFKEGILHEDELFSPQVFIKATKVAIYEKSFYNYRQRQGSIMYNPSNKEKRLIDIFNICFQLTEIMNTLPDSKFKSALLNYIAYVALSNVSYKNKKYISRKVKCMIIHNSSEKGLKLKSFLLNFNESVYYFLSFISNKINKIKKIYNDNFI